jgi:hypothetical protein
MLADALGRNAMPISSNSIWLIAVYKMTAVALASFTLEQNTSLQNLSTK